MYITQHIEQIFSLVPLSAWLGVPGSATQSCVQILFSTLTLSCVVSDKMTVLDVLNMWRWREVLLLKWKVACHYWHLKNSLLVLKRIFATCQSSESSISYFGRWTFRTCFCCVKNYVNTHIEPILCYLLILSVLLLSLSLSLCVSHSPFLSFFPSLFFILAHKYVYPSVLLNLPTLHLHHCPSVIAGIVGIFAISRHSL